MADAEKSSGPLLPPVRLQPPRLRRWLPLLLAGLLATLPAALRASSEGEAPPAAEGGEHGAPPAEGGGHGAPPAAGSGPDGKPVELPEGATPTPAPTPKPDWQVAKPLQGRFDITSLRSLERVAVYRVELPAVAEVVGPPDKSAPLRFAISVEFGNESGCAELEKKQDLVMADLERIASRYTGDELRQPAGRERLREDLVFTINRRLETARVRQVYFLEYLVSR